MNPCRRHGRSPRSTDSRLFFSHPVPNLGVIYEILPKTWIARVLSRCRRSRFPCLLPRLFLLSWAPSFSSSKPTANVSHSRYQLSARQFVSTHGLLSILDVRRRNVDICATFFFHRMGAMLLGVIISAVLHGVCLLQAFIYFTSKGSIQPSYDHQRVFLIYHLAFQEYKQDALFLKTLVSWQMSFSIRNLLLSLNFSNWCRLPLLSFSILSISLLSRIQVSEHPFVPMLHTTAENVPQSIIISFQTSSSVIVHSDLSGLP